MNIQGGNCFRGCVFFITGRNSHMIKYINNFLLFVIAFSVAYTIYFKQPKASVDAAKTVIEYSIKSENVAIAGYNTMRKLFCDCIFEDANASCYFYSYLYNTGQFDPAWVHPEQATVIEINLDTGEQFETTINASEYVCGITDLTND